ncbi:CLUMA_CG001279, isoform A [Clunio marinus]|uniref:CLUMA_CG001279, isoform A n=1 Tax=Clunio marinus TaxID=568069 RepID=A0A1J1HM05_9DIPT|nr:CLUMA_CG001279, isoform A [Clunio marinus]
MQKLVIPPNPNWFMQAICHCTPDNGLLYGAMTKVVYIPPEEEDASKDVKIIDLKNKLCGFSPDPDWVESKCIAVMNADFNVLIYDFASGEAVKGHKGHQNEKHKINSHNEDTAIVFLKQKLVLSSVNSNVIKYCFVSNTFKLFLKLSGRNPIIIFKQSPKDSNIVAAGTKNGLILLISVDKMEVKTKLRGHDSEISSLDWIYLPLKPLKEAKPATDNVKRISLQKLIASTDTSDCFDIYEENVEQEFGTYRENVDDNSDDEETNQGDIQEKIVSNSNFNFLEACKNLKGVILDDKNEATGDLAEGSYEDNKDKYGLKDLDNNSHHESLESNASSRTPVLTDEDEEECRAPLQKFEVIKEKCDEEVVVKEKNESLYSNASSRTPVLTEESLNYLEECQRMKDFVIVSKEDVEQFGDVPVLASGSREQTVWLWDVNERTSLTKIHWHPKARPTLPSPFTNVLWVNQSILIVTDGNGNLNEYKIEFDSTKMNLTAKHQKDKKFDANGVLNICKSQTGSVIWTSSIHRHISCLDAMKDYEKIISLDTIQIRIHVIIENPIDSNVIAIGGNDKRICLWNTSEATHHKIALRPFMNKIHSCVLNLIWHPEKENILVFSTREGRIGILDVNKSSNVPTILSSFSSHEVYSMTWAKIKRNEDEMFIILACDRHKLVYYSQNDHWKFHVLEKFKQSASVSVYKNEILLVGTDNGELQFVDMAKDFKVITSKKICNKYIGMMTWYRDTLAIATEYGITLVKNFSVKKLTTLNDSDFLKLQSHKGRVFSVRFNKSGEHLVSCCISGYIKVWNVESMSVVSSYSIDSQAYSAIFLPSNENFVVCGGQDSTIITFEWKKYPFVQEFEEVTSKKKQLQSAKKIQWAAQTEVTEINKSGDRRRYEKKVVKMDEEKVSDLSCDLVKMKILPKESPIFQVSTRELSSQPLEFIERLLTTNNVDREMSLNEKIFMSRESAKEVVENELEHQKQQLIGKAKTTVVLPQLTDSLKNDILERIATKNLKDVDVAIAPSVSYDLWRKCCLAFAHQCVENGEFLQAISYFLAVNEINACITQLCEGKFFREAWLVAKMRKDESDPIFEVISNKWIGYFDQTGNFETAAALLTCMKNYKKAAEILEKRQNKSEHCLKILKLLVDNHQQK